MRMTSVFEREARFVTGRVVVVKRVMLRTRCVRSQRSEA